ncbi:MAG: DUF2569 domain-containing protein [Metakosakonia sp.]|nr:DUF2569 domain-containing protein [Phytobacter sp.]MBV8872118.1 DUF2569 domain-containing protein [Phytobacter sp.]
MITTPAERIGGWLLAPLAWLLVALLGQTLRLLDVAKTQVPLVIAAIGVRPLAELLTWFASFALAAAVWYYTLWLIIAFFKRRRSVLKHMIIWLLISVLLALKAFAFSPVSDDVAVRGLLSALLAAALIVPYFKRSQRVKATFVNP